MRSVKMASNSPENQKSTSAVSPGAASSKSATKAPSNPTHLARVRENQRRSRARRKTYLQDLESRFRECEAIGIGASAEMQAAARKVLEENRRLKALLRDQGFTDADLERAAVGATSDGSNGRAPTATAPAAVQPGLAPSTAASTLETLINTRRSCKPGSCPPGTTCAPGSTACVPTPTDTSSSVQSADSTPPCCTPPTADRTTPPYFHALLQQPQPQSHAQSALGLPAPLGFSDSSSGAGGTRGGTGASAFYISTTNTLVRGGIAAYIPEGFDSTLPHHHQQHQHAQPGAVRPEISWGYQGAAPGLLQHPHQHQGYHHALPHLQPQHQHQHQHDSFFGDHAAVEDLLPAELEAQFMSGLHGAVHGVEPEDEDEDDGAAGGDANGAR